MMVIDCVDKDGEKIGFTCMLISSAFLIPIGIVIAFILFVLVSVIMALFGKELDFNKLDKKCCTDDIVTLMVCIWIGGVAFSIMWFDSSHGKNFDKEQPKTELSTNYDYDYDVYNAYYNLIYSQEDGKE